MVIPSCPVWSRSLRPVRSIRPEQAVRHAQVQAVCQQMGRLQLRILGLKHPHAEIHSVVRQLPLLQVRGPVGDPDADAGIGFGKVPQNLWDENGGPGRRDSDVQPPGILVRHRLQHREYVALSRPPPPLA